MENRGTGMSGKKEVLKKPDLVKNSLKGKDFIIK